MCTDKKQKEALKCFADQMDRGVLCLGVMILFVHLSVHASVCVCVNALSSPVRRGGMCTTNIYYYYHHYTDNQL